MEGPRRQSETPRSAREKRLAEALRANLKRRKLPRVGEDNAPQDGPKTENR